MKNFSSNPAEMILCLIRNRSLLLNLIHREIFGRYKGSVLGVFWSLINPIFMLAIYTFVFSVVFKARWSYGSDSNTEFALILFIGLIIFNLFSECAARAPNLILSNINYVKKLVFPIEILPWVVMGSALFHFMVSLFVWLLAYSVLLGIPHWQAFFLPLVLIPLVFFVMGISWGLNALGVYLRDVGQFMGLLLTTLLFLSPIFYPVAAIPKKFQIFIYLNPLTTPIEMTRELLYFGQFPSIHALIIFSLFSIIIAGLGFCFFQKTRKGFADVL